MTEPHNEAFIIELGETFKGIIETKDKILNEIRSNIIDERFEILRIYILLNQLSKELRLCEDFFTHEDIEEKVNDIEKQFKKYLVSMVMNDIDLIIE